MLISCEICVAFMWNSCWFHMKFMSISCEIYVKFMWNHVIFHVKFYSFDQNFLCKVNFILSALALITEKELTPLYHEQCQIGISYIKMKSFHFLESLFTMWALFNVHWGSCLLHIILWSFSHHLLFLRHIVLSAMQKLKVSVTLLITCEILIYL